MLYNKRDCGYGCGCEYEQGLREPMMAQQMMAGQMVAQPMVAQPMAAGAYAEGYGCGCPRPCDPIIEPAIEKCVKRDFCHEVRHICPVHTTVVNNHIIRHTYEPQFCCSEENVVTNLDQGSCCNFR